MGYSRKQFEAKGLDAVAWQKYYHRYQQTYIRLKLTCVKCYGEGNSPKQIAGLLSLSILTVRRYITQYLRTGLPGLCQPTQRPQPSLLTAEQGLAFKTVLLTSSPQDHGLEGCIWTAHRMKQSLHAAPEKYLSSGVSIGYLRFTGTIRPFPPEGPRRLC